MTIFDIGDRIWTTKDGQKIKYRDLTESHIKNIAKKTFRTIYQYTSIVDNMDNDIEVEEISYAQEMELELLRRTVSKTLNIEL
jgi:hypothetical protein